MSPFGGVHIVNGGCSLSAGWGVDVRQQLHNGIRFVQLTAGKLWAEGVPEGICSSR